MPSTFIFIKFITNCNALPGRLVVGWTTDNLNNNINNNSNDKYLL